MNIHAHMKILTRFTVVMVICSPVLGVAQERFHIPDSQPIPPDAWQRMDTRSPIDPRIMDAQWKAQEAAQRQREFDNLKSNHAQSFWQQVSRNRSLAIMNEAGKAAAVNDAAHYLALRDMEGQGTALGWMRTKQNSIRHAIRQSEHNAVVGVYGMAASAVNNSGPINALRQQQEVAKAHLHILQALIGTH